MVDGRDWRPNNWNFVLYPGLMLICHSQWGLTLTAFSVYTITLITVLSGYKSFTWPWFVYNIRKWSEIIRCKLIQEGCEDEIKGFVVSEYSSYLKDIKVEYEENSGFHTFHTITRFLVPAMVICSFTSWNLYWLASVAFSASLFPLSIRALNHVPDKHRNTIGEVFAMIREGTVAAVVIGGLLWI